LGTGSLSWG